MPVVATWPVNRGNLSVIELNQRSNTGPIPDGFPSPGGTWQPLDGTLTALAALGSPGFIAMTAADTAALRSIAVPSALLAITNPAGVAGDPTITLPVRGANLVFAGPTTGADAAPAFRALVAADIPSLSGTYQPLDADLTAIAALGSTGIAVRTAANTWAQRTITGDTEIIVANGDGVSGNPTISIGAAIARDSEVTSAIAALSTVYQPLDTDLTAIAALATTAYGRSFLTQAAAANARDLIDLDTTDTPQFARLGLGTAADGSALLKLGSLAGLLLATAGVVSAETYEAGTFTPTITFATPGDLSVAYTSQVGSYVRLGNQVTIAVQITFAATYTTASGVFRLGSLPFTASGTAPNARLLAAWVTGTTPAWPASATYLSGASQQSQTYATIVGYGSAIGAQNFTTTQIVSGTTYTLVLSGTYYL